MFPSMDKIDLFENFNYRTGMIDIGCLNIPGAHVTANNSTNNNVVFFFCFWFENSGTIKLSS